MNIEVKIIDSRLIDNLPSYATLGSAELDLHAYLNAPSVLAPQVSVNIGAKTLMSR